MACGLSQRRALCVLAVSRPSFKYKPRADHNARLKERLVEVARPGTGYRSAFLALEGEFRPLSKKRVYKAWKELGLGLNTKCRKKRTGNPMPGAPTAPGEVWSLDFVHDSCLNGTKLKVLAIIDEFTRECLALEVATSIKSVSVQKVLACLFTGRGAPKYLRSDNGPEFVANSLAVWLALKGTLSRFIKPGSPWQNGKVESFNSRLRAECLNAEAFFNLADAQVKLSIFRNFYNEERRHSALAGHTPASFSKSFSDRMKEGRYSSE